MPDPMEEVKALFVDPFGANAVAAWVEGSGHSVFHAPSRVDFA
jgi:hypothetical protein